MLIIFLYLVHISQYVSKRQTEEKGVSFTGHNFIGTV